MDQVKAPIVSLGPDLFTVRCQGCESRTLAGHGLKGDPCLDVTYDPETKTYICGSETNGCFHRRRQIHGELETTLLKKVGRN